MTAIVGVGKFQSEFSDDLLARDTNGDLWLYPGTGFGSSNRGPTWGVGWNVMTALVWPGDFNGDYKADLMARDAGSSPHYGLYHPGNPAKPPT